MKRILIVAIVTLALSGCGVLAQLKVDVPCVHNCYHQHDTDYIGGGAF